MHQHGFQHSKNSVIENTGNCLTIVVDDYCLLNTYATNGVSIIAKKEMAFALVIAVYRLVSELCTCNAEF